MLSFILITVVVAVVVAVVVVAATHFWHIVVESTSRIRFLREQWQNSLMYLCKK